MDTETLPLPATMARTAKTPFPGESEAYRKARESLLAEEIEFRRHMTRLAEQRRALPPGPVIAKGYRFKDANGNELGMIDLFGDRDALVTYFWMYGPQRERPCPMCTNWLGAVNGKPLTSSSASRSRSSAAAPSSASSHSQRSAVGAISISCRLSEKTTPTTSA
jgi:predicted dithiol-disulfide oxidoreductase (DUF899 family)